MTKDEIEEFRNKVFEFNKNDANNQLEKIKKEFARCGIIDDIYHFDMNLDRFPLRNIGGIAGVRIYPWGDALSNDPDHCDVAELRYSISYLFHCMNHSVHSLTIKQANADGRKFSI